MAIYTFELLRFHRTRNRKQRYHRGAVDDVDLLPRHRASRRASSSSCSAPRFASSGCSRWWRSSRSTAASPGRLDQAIARLDQPLPGDLVVALLLASSSPLGLGLGGGGQRGGAEENRPRAGQAGSSRQIPVVLIYVVVTAARIPSTGRASSPTKANQEDMLTRLGGGVLGSGLDKLLIITVLTSGVGLDADDSASNRPHGALSMAHWKAVTALLARVTNTPHPNRCLRRSASALAVQDHHHGRPATALQQHIPLHRDRLPRSASTGFTGVACSCVYRHDLLESARKLPAPRPQPLIGGLMLFGSG